MDNQQFPYTPPDNAHNDDAQQEPSGDGVMPEQQPQENTTPQPSAPPQENPVQHQNPPYDAVSLQDDYQNIPAQDTAQNTAPPEQEFQQPDAFGQPPNPQQPQVDGQPLQAEPDEQPRSIPENQEFQLQPPEAPQQPDVDTPQPPSEPTPAQPMQDMTPQTPTPDVNQPMDNSGVDMQQNGMAPATNEPQPEQPVAPEQNIQQTPPDQPVPAQNDIPPAPPEDTQQPDVQQIPKGEQIMEPQMPPQAPQTEQLPQAPESQINEATPAEPPAQTTPPNMPEAGPTETATPEVRTPQDNPPFSETPNQQPVDTPQQLPDGNASTQQPSFSNSYVQPPPQTPPLVDNEPPQPAINQQQTPANDQQAPPERPQQEAAPEQDAQLHPTFTPDNPPEPYQPSETATPEQQPSPAEQQSTAPPETREGSSGNETNAPTEAANTSDKATFQLPQTQPQADTAQQHTGAEQPAGTTPQATPPPQQENGSVESMGWKHMLLSKTSAFGKRFQKINFKSALSAALFGIAIFGIFNAQVILGQVQYLTTPSGGIQAPSGSIDANAPAGDENRIIIPQIDVNVPVVYDEPSFKEEKVQKALERGVVHYGTTAFPGENGNTVIVGHSSNNWWDSGKYKFAFILLDKLQQGDKITLHYEGTRYVYEVENKKIVKPDNTSVLNQTEEPRLTLITCTPPGTSWKRLIVQAKQTTPDPSQNTNPDGSTPEGARSLPSDSSRSFFEFMGDLF